MWTPRLDNSLIGEVNNQDGFRYYPESALNQLASLMRLGSSDGAEVESIPDIYHNACKFSMSLFDDSNDANFIQSFASKARREWRALLAICITANIALKGSDFGLVLRDIARGTPGTNNYTNAALQMLPSGAIWNPVPSSEHSPNSGVRNANLWTWHGMKSILLESKISTIEPMAIAFTSPETILFPAADWCEKISRYCPDVFPWVRNGTFYDPSDPNNVKIPAQRVKYMIEWLEDFRIFLKNTESARDSVDNFSNKFEIRNNSKFKKLCNTSTDNVDTSIISQFRNSLKSTYQETLFSSDDSGSESERITLSPLWKTWNFQSKTNGASDYNSPVCESLVSILPKVPKLDKSAIASSEVLVKDTVIDDKPAIFLDENMRGKIAAGMYTVGDALDKDEILREIEEIFYVLRSDDNNIFLPRIFIAPMYPGNNMNFVEEYLTCLDKKCFYSDDNGRRINICALPLTKKGIDLLQAGGNYSLNAKKDADDLMDEIEVSFQITVSDGQKDVSVPIKKVYSGNDEADYLYEGSTLPISAVWPRTDLGNKWKEYWLFCYNTPDADIDSGFPPDPSENNYSLRPINHDPSTIVIPAGYVNASHQYYKLNQFPTFLELCEGVVPVTVGYLKLQPDHDIEINTHSNTGNYTVTLDLGTASTVALTSSRLSPDDRAKYLGAGNIIGISLTEDTTERNTYISKYFVRRLEMPFATLLHDYDINNNAVDRKLYEHSHIYFKELLKRNQRVLENSKVVSNIKWTQGSNDCHLKIFLQDFFRFVLLDARLDGLDNLSNLTLMVSYPDSMTREIQSKYLDNVKTCMTIAAARSAGLTGTFNLKCMTESESAARYFTRRLNGNRETIGNLTRICVIDIGGGTSDIYYSESYRENDSGHTLVRALESSIKIGARNILVEALYQSTRNTHLKTSDYSEFYIYQMLMNANLLFDADNCNPNAPLGISDIKNILDLNRQIDEKSFPAFASTWESLLNRKYISSDGHRTSLGNELLEYWRNPTGKLSYEDRRLLSIIGLNIGAIVYYSAMLMRESLNKTDTLHVAFAGNGSKMLDWLGNNGWQRFFTTIISRALLLDDSNENNSELIMVNFHKSKEHKQEAVEGMFRFEESDAQIAATGKKIFRNSDGKQKLEALPIILAGETYQGIKTFSISDCEEMLQNAYKSEREGDDGRALYENSKNKKINTADKEFVENKSNCDIFEFYLKEENLKVESIGTREFEHFIEAYNEAIESFPSKKLLPIKWEDVVSSSSLNVGSKTSWQASRDIKIRNYINSLASIGENGSLKSFFQIGLEALNERLMR